MNNRTPTRIYILVAMVMVTVILLYLRSPKQEGSHPAKQETKILKALNLEPSKMPQKPNPKVGDLVVVGDGRPCRIKSINDSLLCSNFVEITDEAARTNNESPVLKIEYALKDDKGTYQTILIRYMQQVPD